MKIYGYHLYEIISKCIVYNQFWNVVYIGKTHHIKFLIWYNKKIICAISNCTIFIRGLIYNMVSYKMIQYCLMI